MASQLNTTLTLYDNMVPTLRSMIQSMNTLISTAYQVEQATGDMIDVGALNEAQASVRNIDVQLSQVEAEIIQNRNAQDLHNQSMEAGTQKATDMLSVVKRIGVALASAKAVKWFVNTSDEMADIKARLGMIAREGENVDNVFQSIYRTAQGSRQGFMMTADIVGKLGMQAREAFSSTDEVILFADKLNKQLAIAGTSAAGVESVVYNLTQAMASGVLRGQDLNAVMSNAPNILRDVADYLGKDVSQIRKMAEEGQLSAQVIKEAMFAAADEIDAKFEEMPLKFRDIATLAGNEFLMNIKPALDHLNAMLNSERGQKALEAVTRLLSDLAKAVMVVAEIAIEVVGWVGDNLDWLIPIVEGVVLVYGAWALATQAVSVAQGILNAVMLANPITWIILGVGVLLGLLYKWAQSNGGVHVSWLMLVNAVKTGVDKVNLWITNAAYNFVIRTKQIELEWQKTMNGIKDWAGKAKVGVLMHFQDMVNGAIGYVNRLIRAINSLGVIQISEVQMAATFGDQALAKYQQQKAARDAKYEQDVQGVAKLRRQYDMELQRMMTQQGMEHSKRMAEMQGIKNNQVEAGVGYASDPILQEILDGVDGIGGAAGDISGHTKDLAEKAGIQNEDISYLRELMTQRAITHFTWDKLEVVVQNEFGDVHETADLSGWLDGITEGLHEAINELPAEVPV